MTKLIALAKRSILSITMLTVLALGLGFALPTVARADAGGAPYVTEIYRIDIGGGVTAVYVYYSNGDHTMYYTCTC
jgi:hypothetical protein